MPVAEALARVLDGASPLPGEPAPLAQAADLAALPSRLMVIGEVAAGHPFAGTVGPGEAARIFTGGVMPAGTDTVVIQEVVERDGDTVTVSKPVAKGRNVRVAGLDFREGDTLLAKGRLLTGRDVMLAAAMNHPTVQVHRRPRVGVLATGDELVPPGSALKPGEIVYSNGFALMALAHSEGAEVIDLGVARDRVEEITAAVRRAQEAKADILVTSG